MKETENCVFLFVVLCGFFLVFFFKLNWRAENPFPLYLCLNIAPAAWFAEAAPPMAVGSPFSGQESDGYEFRCGMSSSTYQQ